MNFITRTMNFITKLFDRKKALEAYKKGISFYNEKEFIKAIGQFESMLAEKPLSSSIEYKLAKFYCSQAYRNIGIIQFAKGKNDQALSNFQTALKYNPKHTDLNYFVGICLNNIGRFQKTIEIEILKGAVSVSRKKTDLPNYHFTKELIE